MSLKPIILGAAIGVIGSLSVISAHEDDIRSLLSQTIRHAHAQAVAPQQPTATAPSEAGTALGRMVRPEAPLSPAEVGAIERVIADYLTREPELLERAFIALRQKREAEASQRAQATLAQAGRSLFENPQGPVLGAPGAPLLLIEFLDYSCSFCKQVAPDVKRLLAESQTRINPRVIAILGPASQLAARAALAAHAQGKFEPVHDALLAERGQFTAETIQRIATAAGLDMERFNRDMSSPGIDAELQANQALAQQLGVNGTPSFVTPRGVLPGAMPLDRLREAVAAARRT